MVTKYEFKNFKGHFYVENYEDDDKTGRRGIYDENMRYLEYIQVENELNEYDRAQFYNYIDALQNMKDEHEFFETFCPSYDYGETLEKTMANVIDSWFCVDQDEIDEIGHNLDTMSELDFCEEYDINKVGKLYFKGEW